MAITFGAVSWDVAADEVNPMIQDLSTFERPGAANVTVILGALRYIPQEFGVLATEANSAAADAQLAAAVAQINSNVTLTDQHGDTHAVTVIAFAGRKRRLCDGTYAVQGVYQIVKYTP